MNALARWIGLCAVAALALTVAACDDGAKTATPKDAGGGAGGDVGPGLDDATTGDGGLGGAGGVDSGAGGEDGTGGTGGAEPSIDERCPDAQAGTFMLVVYPDRVDAYRQRDFGGSYFCNFLALGANGITRATGIARGADGQFYVVQPGDPAGEVFTFSENGEFIGRVERNVNLSGIQGIWNSFGDEFIVWSAANSNLYRLNGAGQFRGPYQPPQYQGSRVNAITDMYFVRQDAVVMTFSDRPAKLFAPPFAPEFPAEEIGPGNAVLGVETPEGVKLLMTAQIGGEGNGYGVVLFEAAESGRVAPEIEAVLVGEGEITDGVDLLQLDAGLIVLDSARFGAPRLSVYNHAGEHQGDITLQGGGDPFGLMKERIFPDF